MPEATVAGSTKDKVVGKIGIIIHENARPIILFEGEILGKWVSYIRGQLVIAYQQYKTKEYHRIQQEERAAKVTEVSAPPAVASVAKKPAVPISVKVNGGNNAK